MNFDNIEFFEFFNLVMDEEKVSFDAFKLCWDIIIQESAKPGNTFFNVGHCKILDSRDSSFETIENRLAYIYKYGYFNISFFEKCFLLFISQCPKALFPFENLKVCSLSNGPGLDIIGLLSAFYISNKPLKCLPMFNAINVHESWSELYKLLVCKAYEICIGKSFVEYFHLNPTNINLIQGDIYSTLSPEAKNYISDSNVLLMVNVFASSKATPETVQSSLKEIFTLLQPGSLIFFIGSKNNFKQFSKSAQMKQYVKCVFGPRKVTLNSLPINEQATNAIGVNPCDSGHAQFVVWQKKEKASEEDTVECNNDDSDTLSESSSASCTETLNGSKNVLMSSDKFDLVTTSENTPQSASHNYKINSVENITSILNSIKLKHQNCEGNKSVVCQQDTLNSNITIVSDSVIGSPKKIHPSFQENSLHLKRDNQVLEQTVEKNEIHLKDAASNKNSLVSEIKNGKSVTPRKRSRKSKAKSLNKMEDQSLDEKTKKDNCENTKQLLQKNPALNNSCRNSVKIEREVINQEATNIEDESYYTNSNVQALLQRCDSLISKLEELTVDIKKEYNPSRHHPFFNNTHFCNHQVRHCETLHQCCCVKIMHSCCCRKNCKH